MSFVFDTRRKSPVMSKATLVPLLLFMASLLPGQDGVLDELAAEDPCSIGVFSAVKTYQPGVSFQVGVLVEPDAGWHGYWHSPRDGGDPPEAIWDLPEGWKVSGPDFPVPQRMVEPGNLVSIGYKKPFLLRYRIHPASEVEAEETAVKVEIPLKIIWQVCKTTCIYGESQAVLQVARGGKPIGDREGIAMLARWKERYPVEASDARGFHYQLDWFPDAHSDRVRSGTWVVVWYREGSDRRPAVPVQWVAYPHGLEAGIIHEAQVKPWTPAAEGENPATIGWQVSFRLEELGLGFQYGALGATLVPTPGKAKGPVPGMPAIIIRALQAAKSGPPEPGSGQKKGNGR
ncbi:MAG: protein-disulfide reductase DsbD domain-containing protein [Planctomycetota bacterium]|nr:protein-disulfide reductase DsbD domain-containing protein [Planctomycetota bacterium]